MNGYRKTKAPKERRSFRATTTDPPCTRRLIKNPEAS
jgi:hypothetical protein